MFFCSATGAGAFFSPDVAATAIAAVERIVPRALEEAGQSARGRGWDQGEPERLTGTRSKKGEMSKIVSSRSIWSSCPPGNSP
jgi:hypothetical protein